MISTALWYLCTTSSSLGSFSVSYYNNSFPVFCTKPFQDNLILYPITIIPVWAALSCSHSIYLCPIAWLPLSQVTSSGKIDCGQEWEWSGDNIKQTLPEEPHGVPFLQEAWVW